MSFKGHFKIHGAIHAFWLLGILVSIIVLLTLRLADGSLVNNYISFASSVASLILAVVAIFYSMISNQGFSELVGSIKDSVRDLSKASDEVKIVTTALSEKSETLTAEIVHLKPKFDELAGRLNAQAISQSDDSSAAIETSSSTGFIRSRPSLGGTLALYIMSKSILTGKAFRCEDIFNDNVVWETYCYGVIETIIINQPCGLIVSKRTVEELPSSESTEGDHARQRWEYRVEAAGSFDPAEILVHVAKSTYSGLEQKIAAIDRYFGTT